MLTGKTINVNIHISPRLTLFCAMKVKRFTSLLAIGALLLLTPSAKGSELRNRKQVPIEYQKIEELVNRIHEHNDLGNYPITFTIVNGDYGGWIAEELRLCKEDHCSYYANLNPFGFNRKTEKEIIRQSHLYTDIQGNAYTNGTIKLSQSTFRILQGKDNFLACLLAHEISHVINHDTYMESNASVEGGFDGDSEEDKLKRASLDQESELRADKDSIIMVANSGFPIDSCKRFLAYLAKSTGFAAPEDPYGTHPSDKLRFTNAEKVIADYVPANQTLKNKPRKWVYDPQDNYLFFIPNEG